MTLEKTMDYLLKDMIALAKKCFEYFEIIVYQYAVIQRFISFIGICFYSRIIMWSQIEIERPLFENRFGLEKELNWFNLFLTTKIYKETNLH